MPESPIDITLLVDDPEMIRLVATWPKLAVVQRTNETDIARASAISEQRIADVLFRARVHDLVRDDGTINSFARKWLDGMIASRLAERIGKAKRAQGQKEGSA